MRQIYAFIVARAILLHLKCAIIHILHTLERAILHYSLLAICSWIHIITFPCIIWCNELGLFIAHCLYRYAYRHPSSVLVLCRHHILEARDILCFHFSFWLHGHAFVARISYSCRHGVYYSFFLSDAGFRIVIVWYKGALSSLSSLRYISSVLFRLGVLLVILLSPWLLSHFSIAKLRQADYRKYRWHYLHHKKIGNLPHFYVFRFHFSVFRSPKVGIPSFFLEIICLCSFLAHFWIAL